jgi:hypothetical protein
MGDGNSDKDRTNLRSVLRLENHMKPNQYNRTTTMVLIGIISGAIVVGIMNNNILAALIGAIAVGLPWLVIRIAFARRRAGKQPQ